MKKYSKYGAIKKFFHEYDLFKSPANLRFNQQPDVSQLCSGIFSFLLIIFFAYVLINQFVKVVNYESIQYDETAEALKNLTQPSASNIRFSIAPAWTSYSSWTQLFQVTTTFVSLDSYFGTSDTKKLPMKKCEQQDWKDYSQIFNDLQFGQNICLSNPKNVTILGSNFMDRMDSLLIHMSRCTTKSNPNCTTNQTLFQQELQSLYLQGANYMNFYIIDTSINADKQFPIQQYIRMNFDFIYTYDTRLSVNIYLGMYVVQTDHSLWPLSDGGDKVVGYYISHTKQDQMDKNMERAYRKKDIYGQVYIYMTNKRRKFIRKRGKLDTVISYAGGLFGILTGIFAYFINSYNQYSYQLRVAQSSFNYDQHGNQVKQKHFNFLKYIKFTIYDWVKFLFCYDIPWDYDTKKDQTRQEANATMDVIHLFRKIQLIQLVLGYMIDKNQLILYNLTKPPTLKQVQNQRLCMEYYHSIIRGKFAINVQDLKKKNNTIHKYRQLQSKKSLSSQNNQKNDKQQVPSSTQLNKMTTSVILNQFGQAVNPDENNMIKQQKKIREKFMLYSRIQSKELIDGIASCPQIAIQARELTLYPEMVKIQEELAQIYYDLSPEIRDKVLDRIPLKILHRLVDCIERKQKQENSPNKKREHQQAQQLEKQNQLRRADQFRRADCL